MHDLLFTSSLQIYNYVLYRGLQLNTLPFFLSNTVYWLPISLYLSLSLSLNNYW
jgi:hypothetical protein